MAFDDSHVRTAKQQAQDRADAAAKRLMIDAYRKPFLDAFKRCPCHCHLEQEGIQCKCVKNCEHCQPTIPRRSRA
jgi:hypothetical protein